MEEQDKFAFDKPVKELLKLTGKFFNPTPSEVKRYWLAAERFPLDTVLGSIAAMSRDHVGHITPGDLSRACLERQNAARRRKEFSPGPPQATVYTAADDAAHAQAMADCRRMLE